MYSTRCPPLPRLRMRESREIVHRAVLRSKGLDPDLVPSPSKRADARGPRSGERKQKIAGAAAAASPRGPPPPTPSRARDLDRGSSFSHADHVPKRPAPPASSDAPDDATDDARLSGAAGAAPKKRSGRRENLFLEDVELETLLPKSRGGVGGGGGGDFTRGVGATHFLRVQHEVQNARVERRVRLALVDPNAAPEVDAVDAASEIPGVKIFVPRGKIPSSRDEERRTDKNAVSSAGRVAARPPRPRVPSPYAGSEASSRRGVSKNAAKNGASSSDAKPASPVSRATARAPSREGFVAAEVAAGKDLEPSKDLVGSLVMSPRAARHSASLRALVAEAPAHVAAAVDDVAKAARRRETRESRARAAKVRSLADARNAACDRNAKTLAELERLRDELDRARQTNRGEAEGSRASGSRADALRAEIGSAKTFAEEEAERAKTREHVASRLRETVALLRRGVDKSRETIAECDADVAACGAYADDALRSERSAGAALEWIKKKYLLKANSWKKDLEAQKAIREALAEELRELRAADRRRGARDARARAASEAFEETRKEKEDSDRARRDLETQSEDLAKSNMIRLAVAVGLAHPETRTPDAIVEAVNANERRRAEALAKVEELQAKEAEMSRVLAERRERLRETRLGVFEELRESESEDVELVPSESVDAPASTTTHQEETRVATRSRRSARRDSALPTTNVDGSAAAKRRSLRHLELELARADRSLARKFTRFRRVAARLVAVDEGLKKMNDAVARTRARVGDAVSDPNPSHDRPAETTAFGTLRRLRASTLGRPPIDRGNHPGFSRAEGRLARPSAGGRAAEARETDDDDVNASNASPTRRSSTPASPTLNPSVGGDARTRGGRPGSAVSACAALAARPPRVSRTDPFGVFDRLSRPRASAAPPRRGGREKNADVDRDDGVFGAPEKRAEKKPRSDADDSADDSADDAASTATRVLASALPARFENTMRSVIEVLGSIPRGADGSPARASVVLGGARDVVSGALRGGLAGYPSAASRGAARAKTKTHALFVGHTVGATSCSTTTSATSPSSPTCFANRRDTDETNDSSLRFLLCARPGKVPVAAGEVDDDPARMRLKRGRAYREMAMKWCFRAGRPIADDADSGDELHAVAGEDGVLRFNRDAAKPDGTSASSREKNLRADPSAGALGGDGGGPGVFSREQTHTPSGPNSDLACAPHGAGALDLARAANVGLSAAGFRRLVARTRKAGVVPTRADLKRASQRAEEKRAREIERAKRRAEEAE